MTGLKAVAAIAVLCIAGFISSCSDKNQAAGPIDPQTLFKRKCSLCHSIARPMALKKTQQEWEQTVIRMKNVNGAGVTEEEARIIIEYLAKNHGV